MCGRLSQYSGIHDFVAALSMPSALINYAGDQPFELYNAAPTTQLALFHQEGQFLRADMVRWGWRPHWAKDRAAPLNARVEKMAHGPFFVRSGHTARSSPSTTGLSGWMKADQEAALPDPPS